MIDTPRKDELETLLQNAEMRVEPDWQRMQAVHEQLTAAPARNRPHRQRKVVFATTGILLGVSALALGGTQSGRNLVRWVFTRVETPQVVSGQSDDNHTWMVSRSVRTSDDGAPAQAAPFTPDEVQDINKRMAEVHQLRLAGKGRVAGLIETPTVVVWQIEYTLANGSTQMIGESEPAGTQGENLHVKEILQLRDSGAGEIISQKPSDIGLGRFTIRLTLADGSTQEIETSYPPGARHEREAIFSETRQLKSQLRFKVLNPSKDSDGGVRGILLYTLADGRKVGIIEDVPAQAIGADGMTVMTPSTAADEEEPSQP